MRAPSTLANHPSRRATLRPRLRAVLLACAVLLSIPVRAHAQTTPPTRPAIPATVKPNAPSPQGAKPVVDAKELEKQQKRAKNKRLADEFFAGSIVKLEIEFSPEQWEALKKENRQYAEATLTEIADGKKTVFKKAAVKLKGSAGSSRGVDDKPGLTVSLSKFKGADRFHGMKKFHLNNGVQDGSLLNEYISGEMCRAAGVPASRCTHLVLKWQGRDMGVYIFKESFTEDFFSYFYERVDGSLYDGHFIADIDAGEMEKQEGDPADRSDIQGLAEAVKEPNEAARWQKIGERLDVAQFLRFLAMETFTSHWDGYNFNQNNYRVYFDSKTKKANFFAHGMDQTWGLTNWSVLRDPISLVGTAVMSNPAWRADYRKISDALYAKVLNSREWDNRLQRQGRKVQDAIQKASGSQAAKDFAGQIDSMRSRLKARIEAIGQQFPKPLGTNANIIPLAPRGWHGDGGGTLDEVQADGQKTFHIAADGKGPAAWKIGIILPKGSYKFSGRVKVANVSGTPAGGREVPKFGNTGVGAGLRISGASRAGKCEVQGTAGWQQVSFDFDTPGGEVIFMAELASASGEAWFSRNTLTLTKVR